MAKRTKRNNLTATSLILFGAFFVSLSTTHFFFRRRALTLDQQTVNAYIATLPIGDPREDLLPTHIYSQYFLDVAIEPQVYEQGRWTISENYASYLVSSARPTESGNIILYGHNKRSILGNIRAYKGGELIILTVASGEQKKYRVTSTELVDPSDTTLLTPTTTETLTIYTCGGIFDSQRFVITATPIK